jgi:hypothetical protein
MVKILPVDGVGRFCSDYWLLGSGLKLHKIK